jgi:hypothetical protein
MLKFRGLKGFKQGVKRCGKVNARLQEKPGWQRNQTSPAFYQYGLQPRITWVLRTQVRIILHLDSGQRKQ